MYYETSQMDEQWILIYTLFSEICLLGVERDHGLVVGKRVLRQVDGGRGRHRWARKWGGVRRV